MSVDNFDDAMRAAILEPVKLADIPEGKGVKDSQHEKRQLHGMNAIPSGKTVGQLIPAFATVTREVRIGSPNHECAGCFRPFEGPCQPLKAIRIYPTHAVVPLAFSYNLCGDCAGLIERGGSGRDTVLAGVEHYHEGGQ